MGRTQTDIVTKAAMEYRFRPTTFSRREVVLGGRRVDVVSIALQECGSVTVHGMEVKTNYQDFKMEMGDPDKSAQGVALCDSWWLVTIAGLVDVSEVPRAWGLIEVCYGKATITKVAKRKRRRKTLPAWFMARFLRAREDTPYIHSVGGGWCMECGDIENECAELSHGAPYIEEGLFDVKA